MNEVMIVGGPRDGATVPYTGPLYREPMPVRHRLFTRLDEAAPLTAPTLDVREYDLHWWWTGAESVPRYVLREQAKGLGASS